MHTRLVSTLIISAVIAGAAHAQAPLSGKSSVLSIQPVSSMLTVYTGEYELALSRSATVGVGATKFGGGDIGGSFNYLSGDLKLRYYPDGRAFQGFSFGGSVGMTRVSASSDNLQDEGSVTKPSIGIMLDYGWLLGASKSFYVGMGVGAKALFLHGNEFEEDFTARYPTARLSVGLAF